jgi:hypothetical protein
MNSVTELGSISEGEGVFYAPSFLLACCILMACVECAAHLLQRTALGRLHEPI